MKIFKTIAGFFGKAANAVAVAVGLGRQVAPYVEAARKMSPAVDAYVDKLEAVVQSGGQEADDFLDRNLETLQALYGFFGESEEWSRAGVQMVEHLIVSSQSETPDVLTPEEAAEFAKLAEFFVMKTKALATRSAESRLEEKLASLK